VTRGGLRRSVCGNPDLGGPVKAAGDESLAILAKDDGADAVAVELDRLSLGWPVRKSQACTLQSEPPVRRRFPSGLKARPSSNPPIDCHA